MIILTESILIESKSAFNSQLSNISQDLAQGILTKVIPAQTQEIERLKLELELAKTQDSMQHSEECANASLMSKNTSHSFFPSSRLSLLENLNRSS